MIEFYHSEKNRFTTFEAFFNKNSQVISSLCRNGFISTNGGYICVFCYKKIANVGIKDDILKRHFNMTKTCNVFVGESNVPINIEMFSKEKERYFKMNIDKRKSLKLTSCVKNVTEVFVEK